MRLLLTDVWRKDQRQRVPSRVSWLPSLVPGRSTLRGRSGSDLGFRVRPGAEPRLLHPALPVRQTHRGRQTTVRLAHGPGTLPHS